ncbi:hypothetical protein SISSUDRAFT_358192 [Sistotremastrum suecicum HHB10207 ss-3]|uniref:Uncharacterized protein n=1 Tax=Sistotremastrum suecicum HHB10207 ss-3 TaxID=1314776 RepID=A0A165Z7X2_9AGAM|nr:hypothetical protein SISSUDRAFT_358192 [Sistotremastrum suecicum HHB10207 ss-3]
MMTGNLLIGGILLGWLSGIALGQTPTGNTVCKGVAMDWYTVAVKETPCRTYERLRQTCNSNYTVGMQTVHGSTLKGAPDACIDPNPACCCNYIAFALSMLCLNCQQNVGSLLFAGKDGTGQDTGYLAGAGSFQLYLTNFGQSPQCAPQLNTSFPQNVQQQVCLEGLNIDDNLYSPTNFSPDGSWCKQRHAKHAAVHGFSKLHVQKMRRSQYQSCDHCVSAFHQHRLPAKSICRWLHTSFLTSCPADWGYCWHFGGCDIGCMRTDCFSCLFLLEKTGEATTAESKYD